MIAQIIHSSAMKNIVSQALGYVMELPIVETQVMKSDVKVHFRISTYTSYKKMSCANYICNIMIWSVAKDLSYINPFLAHLILINDSYLNNKNLNLLFVNENTHSF